MHDHATADRSPTAGNRQAPPRPRRPLGPAEWAAVAATLIGAVAALVTAAAPLVQALAPLLDRGCR